MAIDIKYSGSGLQPVSVNIPTNKVGSIIASAGEQLTAISDEKERKKKVARDNMYIATKSIEARDALSNLEKNLTKDRQDYTGYAKEYTKGAEAVYQKIIDDAPSDEARQLLIQSYAAQRNSLANSAESVEATQLDDQYQTQTIAALNQSANELILHPDRYKAVLAGTETMMEAAKGSISPEAYRKIDEQRQGLIAGSFMTGVLNQDPARAKKIIESGKMNSVLSPKETAGFLDAANREIESRARATQAMQTQLSEKTKLDYQTKILYGKTNEGEIWGDEGLSQAQKVSLTKEIRTANKEQVKLSESIALGEKVGTPGYIAAPSDKDAVKGVTDYFENIVKPSLQGMEASEQTAAIIKFVDSKKIIPTNLRDTMSGQITNGHGKDRQAAADMLVRMATTTPAVMSQFSASEQLLAKQISNISRTTPNVDIDAVIKDSLDPAKQGAQAERQKTFLSAAAKVEPSSSLFQTGFLGIGNLEPTPEARAYWKNIVQTHYVQRGADLEVSMEAADIATRAVFGETEINGHKQIMRQSPELMYGQSSEVLRTNLLDFVAKEYGVVKDRVYVQPITGPQGHDHPKYIVGVTNGLTGTALKDKNNRLLIWDPSKAVDPQVKEDSLSAIKQGKKRLGELENIQNEIKGY